MRGILKNTLLLLGGMALGSLATRRAIRYAVENRYDRVKYEEPIFGTGEDAEQVLDPMSIPPMLVVWCSGAGSLIPWGP